MTIPRRGEQGVVRTTGDARTTGDTDPGVEALNEILIDAKDANKNNMTFDFVIFCTLQPLLGIYYVHNSSFISSFV